MSAQQWGRVDAEGTVWVRTAAGERAVGQYPGATEEEARQKAVQEALDQCDRLRGAGDYERARAVLNNALDRSPDDARLKDALTRVRLAQMAEEHLKAKKSAGSTPAPEKQ